MVFAQEWPLKLEDNLLLEEELKAEKLFQLKLFEWLSLKA